MFTALIILYIVIVTVLVCAVLGLIYIKRHGKTIVLDRTDPDCQQILLDIKKYRLIG